jgi:hypothetical protein
MKTALCLYGQPRDAHSKFGQIYENVIAPNDCDVFFHTWYDNTKLGIDKMTPGHENRTILQGMDQFLINSYKPKSCAIEPQIEFFHKNFSASDENIEACWPYSRAYDQDQFIKHKSKAVHSMWYSINRSIMMKDLYSHQNNFTYDAVILSRFDVCPTSPVRASDYDLTKVIVRDYQYPRREVSDWFLISNDVNMNVVGGVFFSLERLYTRIKNSTSDIWTNEAFLREQLDLNGIDVTRGKFEITF